MSEEVEFECPEEDNDPNYEKLFGKKSNLVSTEYCESMAKNAGCKFIKTCKAYLEVKNAQK